MENLSRIWERIQDNLFPSLGEVLDPLTDKQKKLVAILELVRIEEFVPRPWWKLGRPVKDRVAVARAFVAKMVFNLATTRDLIDRLKSSPNLRRLCGFETLREIPSESTFSRAFEEFASTGLPAKVHEELIGKHESPRLVGHISRDSSDIKAREKAKKKPRKEKKKRGRRGRPKKGEEKPSEPTRLERQMEMTLGQMLEDLPKDCDWGTKKKNGKLFSWGGYKLHVDWADGEIPVSCILTGASVHDSQVAIPLAEISAGRVSSLYDLMDAAYDAEQIRTKSRALGHVPIIDTNPRRGEKTPMDPAEKRRYDERSTAERGFSFFKESFGGGHDVRVRGHAKVYAHLMFGILALTAERLLTLV